MNIFKKGNKDVIDKATEVQLMGGMAKAEIKMPPEEIEKIKNKILSKNDLAARIKTWETNGYTADWEAIAKGYKANSNLGPTTTPDNKIVWGKAVGVIERAPV